MKKMDKTKKPFQAGLVIIGEWQVAREKAMEAAARFLEGSNPDAITVLRGDEIPESQVLEALKTRGIFSEKQVVIYRDPDFLTSGKKGPGLVTRLKQAIKEGKDKRAARIFGRILSEKGLGQEELSELNPSEIGQMLRDQGLDGDELGNLLKNHLEEIKRAVSPSSHSGLGLLSWLKKRKKGNHFLIIQLSDRPKNVPLFKEFLEACQVVDLDLSSIKGKAASAGVSQFVREQLKQQGKEMERAGLDEFLRLVGASSLSAIKNELQKLVSLTGNKKRITRQDVLTLVVRHKEEELYRLTEAFRKKKLSSALLSLDLLLEQDIHPLAILAAIRNSIIRTYALKSVSKECSQNSRAGFNQFKEAQWPEIKKTLSKIGAGAMSRMHPYSAYLHLASPYSEDELAEMLKELPGLDLAMKGSKLEPRFVLENFFFRHLS